MRARWFVTMAMLAAGCGNETYRLESPIVVGYVSEQRAIDAAEALRPELETCFDAEGNGTAVRVRVGIGESGRPLEVVGESGGSTLETCVVGAFEQLEIQPLGPGQVAGVRYTLSPAVSD